MKAPMIIAKLLLCSTLSVHADAGGGSGGWQPVSGSGIHYFTSAIEHDREETTTGYVQRSTETVDLTGDLNGRVLYQPRSVFDFSAGTLINTGRQVFSGTVLGSDPVLIYDDEFRFEVNLHTGETRGEVYLLDRIAGPRIRCRLRITGAGQTPEGNSQLNYEGECRLGREHRSRNSAG